MPEGSRVSRAIVWGSKAAQTALSGALNAIDAVHNDGDLPPLPVRFVSPEKLEDRGIYNYRQITTHGVFGASTRFVAENILIQQQLNQHIGAQPELSFVHETGHFIDQQGWKGRGWASVDSADLAEFRQAADATAAIQELRRLVALDAVIVPQASNMIVTVPQARIAYLLQWQEIWARAYSQYIAVKSGDAVLTSQVEEERSRFSFLPLPRQWRDEEFVPVAEAITRIFDERGRL